MLQVSKRLRAGPVPAFDAALVSNDRIASRQHADDMDAAIRSNSEPDLVGGSPKSQEEICKGRT